MVRYRSDGVFEAPVDKVWKFWGDDKAHVHSGIKFTELLKQEGNSTTFAGEAKGSDGKWVKIKATFTANPPGDFAAEFHEGPLAGSKFTQKYIPDGAKTKLVLEGEFKVKGAKDDKAALRTVESFFDTMYGEDQALIRKYE